jgi:hypothetical protein
MQYAVLRNSTKTGCIRSKTFYGEVMVNLVVQNFSDARKIST